MTAVARVWLALAFIATLFAYGGEGDLVRPLFGIALALALVLAVFSLRRQYHPPPVAWIAVLFLPLILLTALQVLPFGWHHPWLSQDLAVLGGDWSVWSIDPSASTAALGWFVTLAGFALVVSLLARGGRLASLVDALLYVAALTAVFGLVLVLTGSTWPSDSSQTRVRGPFIYPNHAAAFWAACLPLAAFTAHRRRGTLRWGTVAVLVLALLLSGSRGGILVASVVMLPIAVYLLPRARRWWWATGGAMVVAAWLSLIGISEVTDKFERLRGDEGATLSGRTLLWQAAWPVILDAGVLGSGAGTTLPAYRRAGEDHFAGMRVDHLHSDPLEWSLEYGWLGVLVLLAAAIGTAVRLRPESTTWRDPTRRGLVCGAAAGLAALLLHCCGDFIWSNPMLALTGVVLLCIIALAGRSADGAARPRSAMRLAGCALAVVVAAGAGWSWPWYTHTLLARDVDRLIAARHAANLPLTGASVIEQARTTSAASVRLCLLQTWLAQADGDLAAADAACVRAAALAPGDAAVWAQRALIAAAKDEPATVATAIARALAWAPAWPDIQQDALRLIAGHRRDLLPEDQIRTIIGGILSSSRPQPPWFFPLAAEVLGEAELVRHLREADPALARSAEDWLAQQGPVTEWVALRWRLSTTRARLPAGLALAHGRLLPEDSWQPRVPLAVDDRRSLADRLADAGLPIPPLLRESLERDGRPWSLWSGPLDLLSADTRRDLALVLRSELHRAWARQWSDRLRAVNGALAGDTAMITRDLTPSVLARLAGIAPFADPAMPVDEAISRRARAVLERWRIWEWQELPDQAGRWSWWYGDGSDGALVTCERWTGLVIDGVWIGWIRGTQDLRPLLGSGLRRVVLLTP